MLLKGTIFVTDNLESIYNAPLDGKTKIVNLDEDGILPESKDIIGGTCLLPPMEAKIAEADGNEQVYDAIYSNHLLAPYQQKFVSALIAFLYRGGNLLLFLPELGYDNTTKKLIEHLFRIYGIHIGLIGNSNPQISNCYYDEKCIPIWLNLIYTAGVTSAYEYLYAYPLDAPINNNEVVSMLINDIRPYGKSFNEKILYIEQFRHKIHYNPNVRPAISCLEV